MASISIDSGTELFGIIGNPVRHSLSPMLHNYALKKLGLNAVYLAFEVRDLRKAIAGMRGLGIRGLSVTTPFKNRVIPMLDEVDEEATKARAVNTILNQGDKLLGYNTDGIGALGALESTVELRGARVALIGAGDAARAIAFSLKAKGSVITIINRTAERAEHLAAELGCEHRPLHTIEEEGLDADVLVNATSAGMFRRDETPVRSQHLKKNMVVMDIVYQPLETRLLREARERGCVTVDGVKMLVHQGVAQLRIWTGTTIDPAPIEDEVRRAIDKKTDGASGINTESVGCRCETRGIRQ